MRWASSHLERHRVTRVDERSREVFAAYSIAALDRRTGTRRGVPDLKAIVVTDQAAGTAGMTLVERPEPGAAINDVVVEVHASGFVPTELAWPSTWTDRLGRDRTPSIPGHELAGVVTALGYGTTGLSVGQRVFGLTDWTRDGTLAEYVAVEARNLAPLPGDVDFTVGASLPISGLTAWQGLFVHGRLQVGAERPRTRRGGRGRLDGDPARRARPAPTSSAPDVPPTGRRRSTSARRSSSTSRTTRWKTSAESIWSSMSSAATSRSGPRASIRAGGALVTVVGPPEARPSTAWRSTSSSSPIVPNWLRSSSGCGTDGYGRTSATSRPSTMPSPRSTRPSDVRERPIILVRP